MLNISLLRYRPPNRTEEVESFLIPKSRDEAGNLTPEAQRCLQSALDSLMSNPEEYTIRIHARS